MVANKSTGELRSGKASLVNGGVFGGEDTFHHEMSGNIVCYRDEGGGEDDVRAYDMYALRIQIPNSGDRVHFVDKSSVNYGESLLNDLLSLSFV